MPGASGKAFTVVSYSVMADFKTQKDFNDEYPGCIQPGSGWAERHRTLTPRHSLISYREAARDVKLSVITKHVHTISPRPVHCPLACSCILHDSLSLLLLSLC